MNIEDLAGEAAEAAVEANLRNNPTAFWRSVFETNDMNEALRKAQELGFVEHVESYGLGTGPFEPDGSTRDEMNIVKQKLTIVKNGDNGRGRVTTTILKRDLYKVKGEL